MLATRGVRLAGVGMPTTGRREPVPKRHDSNGVLEFVPPLMDLGTRSLARSSAAYLACLAFALVYLLSAAYAGAHWTTALMRGGIAAIVVLLIGRLLLYPLVDTVLSAVSEAERERREAEE